MPTAKGKNGYVSVSGSTTIYGTDFVVRGWNADITLDVFDDTGMDATTPPVGRSKITGLQDCKGTVNLKHASNQIFAIPSGAELSFVLYADTPNSVTYSFTGIITGFHPAAEIEGEILCPFDFEMSDSAGVVADVGT